MKIKDDLPENRTSRETDQDRSEGREDALATFQMSCLAHFKVSIVFAVTMSSSRLCYCFFGCFPFILDFLQYLNVPCFLKYLIYCLDTLPFSLFCSLLPLSACCLISTPSPFNLTLK